MALDATVAGSSSDSYISVATADLFAAADLGPEAAAWLAAVTADKEKALKRATREIDGYLRTGWARYTTTQALLFPRSIDYSGTPAAAFIARSVQLACYEQATYVLANAQVMDRAASRRARDLQAASEPNTSYTQASPGDTPTNLSPAALAYLTDYRNAGTRRGLHSVRVATGYVR